MIEDFIDSALIIDDVEGEIEGLMAVLLSKDIYVKYYSPEEIKGISGLRNRKIIFLDLYLSKTSGNDIEGHISEIRRIFTHSIGKNFGSYGIVLWSAHNEQIDALKQKMSLDIQKDSYSAPLFIVGLPKTKYLKDGFGSFFNDLNEKVNSDTAANFFIQWETLVKKGKDKAINSIYSLANKYENQEKHLRYILYKIAENYTGVDISKTTSYPLEGDAYKAFNDLLHYEIVNETDSVSSKILHNTASLQSYDISNEDKEKLYSEINSKLFIDTKNIKQAFPIPGNVYKLTEVNSQYKVEDCPADSIPVIIEITPPCDFSNNKKGGRSRILSGFIYEYSKAAHKYNSEHYYKELWPIKLPDKENSQMIIFDFRYTGSLKEVELKDATKYQILFRAKDKLFADILQKLSSHVARLGLSIIH